MNGFQGMLKYLINNGADLEAKDNTGFTALLYAVKAERIDVSLYLITRGADMHVGDCNGCTPLIWAGFKNNVWLF